jgi:hypothetical protein
MRLDEIMAGQVGCAWPSVGAAPAGFVQLFKGWNVWDVWQSQDPAQGIAGSVLNAGVPLDRQLRIWVEDEIREHAPAAAVADTANPLVLKGSQVEILSGAGGLEPLQTRADIPELAGALQLGNTGSQADKFTVRFFNRGDETGMAWPHDENYVLDTVYQPSSTNPITNGAAPTSLGGIASGVEDSVSSALKVVAIVAGVGIGAYLLVQLINARKVAA